jgi:hypothetical protein
MDRGGSGYHGTSFLMALNLSVNGKQGLHLRVSVQRFRVLKERGERVV